MKKLRERGRRALTFLLALIMVFSNISPVLPAFAEAEISFADMEPGVRYSATFKEYDVYLYDKDGNLAPYNGGPSTIPVSEFPANLIVVLENKGDKYVRIVNEDWPAAYDAYRYAGDIDIAILERLDPVVPTPGDGLIYGEVGLVVDGKAAAAMTIAKGEKTNVFTDLSSKIENPSSYSWQLLIDEENDRWANITDYVYPYANVSEALIANAGLEGGATLRCIVTADNKQYVSDELRISVDPNAAAPAPFAPVDNKPTGNLSGSSASRSNTEAFHVQIDYIYWNNSPLPSADHGGTALPTFTATVSESLPLTATVPSLPIAGYKAYIRDDTQIETGRPYEARENPSDPNSPVEKHYYVEAPNITFNHQVEAFSIKVYYLPIDVSLTVNHYIQNLDNDEYTLHDTDDLMRPSVSPVGEGLQLTLEGFSNLFYDPNVAVSASGNTTVNIYYDRNYYLVDFDLSGPHDSEGYGVMPLYVRYGTTVQVGTPQNPGYTFTGWELLNVYFKEETVDENGTIQDIKTEIVDTTIRNQYANAEVALTIQHNLNYKSNWKVATTTYTVIYWLENADDDRFTISSFKVVEDVETGTTVSASDDWTHADKDYFTFNSTLSDKNVVVKGDGTTSINVYYLRKYYTLTFTDSASNGSNCIREEHTHDDSCPKGTCSLENHTHSAECGIASQTCGKEEHIHSTECCALTYHKHGDADCPCDIVEHSHVDTCYNHVLSCYTSKALEPTNNQNHTGNISDPQNGYVYRYKVSSGFFNSTYYNYFYIGNKWYSLGDSSNANTIKNTYGIIVGSNLSDPGWNVNYTSIAANLLNSHSLHCGMQPHTHGEGTCSCKVIEHDHTSGCVFTKCGKEQHYHTSACYTYSCGQVEHTHGGDCVRTCQILEHTHGSSCNDNFQIIKRKYGADISEVWREIWDKYPNGERWSPSRNDFYSEVLVYLPFMPPANITFTKDVGQSSATYYNYRLHYYLESLGTSGTSYGDRYYDLNNTVTARYGYLSRKEDFFNIAGFTQHTSNPEFNNENKITQKGGDVSFYYTRNTYQLKFVSNGAALTTLDKTLMYQQPITSQYEPTSVPYPTNKEANAVTFEGWYTTPTFADGTRFFFDGSTEMPLGGLTLYAKWEPTYWNITVYQEKPTAENPNPVKLWEHTKVPFGTLPNTLGKEPERKSPVTGYIFAGWYYEDENGQEKRFDFNTMPIKQNLVIYAKWTSEVPVDYIVYYKAEIGGVWVDIAAPSKGQSLAGVAKSFAAKSGSDLYAGYRTGYFPTAREQTKMMELTQENDGLNIITFEYVTAEEVNYQIKHVFVHDDFVKLIGTDTITLVWQGKISGTGSANLEEKFNDEITYDNVIKKLKEKGYEAKAKDIWNIIIHMSPDAFNQSLTLVAGADAEQNEIVFNWSPHYDMTIYEVHHVYKPNGSDEPYLLRREKFNARYILDENGKAPQVKLPASIVVKGYKYANRYETNNSNNQDLSLKLATAAVEGLIITMYYDREEYQYTVRYKDKDGLLISHDPVVKGTGYYLDELTVGTVVKDVNIPGYTLVNGSEKVVLEYDGQVIDCIYQKRTATYHYRVLSGYGGLSSLTDKDILFGEQPKGSQATPQDGWILEGWYYSENNDTSGLKPVSTVGATVSEDGTLIPRAVIAEDVGKQFFFWAKFVPTSLTIQSTIAAAPANAWVTENQGFIYRITGDGVNFTVAVPEGESVTILGLPGGVYTITAQSSWSWRYDKEGENTRTVTISGNHTVVFEYNFPSADKDDKYYLTDEAFAITKLP